MRTFALLLGLAASPAAHAQLPPDWYTGKVLQHDEEIGVVLYIPVQGGTSQIWYLYPGFLAPTARNRAAFTVVVDPPDPDADPPQPDADPPDPDRVLADVRRRHPGGTTITAIAR